MFDLQSFLSGLALGLAGKPLALAREPVAYLYNGVRLPKLPEWDRETYPYAVIFKNVYTHVYSLCFSPSLYTAINNDRSLVLTSAETEDTSPWYSLTDGEWEYQGMRNGSGLLVGMDRVTSDLWTNTDIRFGDGTLLCAATDPIPVYE